MRPHRLAHASMHPTSPYEVTASAKIDVYFSKLEGRGSNKVMEVPCNLTSSVKLDHVDVANIFTKQSDHSSRFPRGN
jgi:hypothetical protein